MHSFYRVFLGLVFLATNLALSSCSGGGPATDDGSQARRPAPLPIDPGPRTTDRGPAVAGLSLGSGGSSPILRPLSGAQTPSNPPTLTPTGIKNFHVVHPFLLRGAAPTPEGMEWLKKTGVKTVIDLRIAPKAVARERQAINALGMRFINLPMSAAPPSKKEIDTFLATARDPASQPVYVHCQYGADRTGTMVGIYREQVDGWKFDPTYKEMRKYGFKPFLGWLKATVRKYAPGK